jgi:hypothetical protein
MNGRCVRTAHLTTALRTVRTPELVLPPGATTLRLTSSQPATRVAEGDTRLLGFAAYDVEIEVRPEPEEPDL